MRTASHTLVAGCAVLALVATAALAHAQGPLTHVLDVALPDGSVAHIRYAGDVPPQVILAPVAAPAAFAPAADPFLAFDRLAAQMDLRAAAMLRVAQAMTLSPLPPGVQGYSTVTTINGNQVCTRSTTYTGREVGAAPQMITHVSGDCAPGPAPRQTLPAMQPAPHPLPRTIEARAEPQYRAMIRPIAAWQQ